MGRHRISRWIVPAAAVVAVAVAAGAAQPGSPGHWTRVTAPGRNIDQVGLARTADGVLHVAWLRASGAQEQLVHSAIASSGAAAGGETAILPPWSDVTNPSLVVQPSGGLLAVFAGIRTTDPSDPYSGGTVYSAAAPAAGTGWTLQPGALAPPSSASASDLVPVAYAAGGTLVTAWASTFGTDWHVGGPAAPAQVAQEPCCGYQTALARDAGGAVVLAWYSNARSGQGTFAQQVAPSPGPRRLAPGSVTVSGGTAQSLAADQITAVTGRLGAPGVYLAYGSGYPTARSILVWRYGTTKPQLRLAADGARLVGIAAAPQGRLWVFWQQQGLLHAVRTNRAATRFGAVVDVKPPAGTQTIYKTRGEGSLGPLDLFAGVDTGGTVATWHTQVLPPLALAVRVGKAEAKQPVPVQLVVRDAGDPVAGAVVTVAGRRVATGADGRAEVRLPAGRRTLSAVAAKAGYAGASASFRLP